MSAFSLYLHIPFCRHRCAYCDFNTYAGLARWIPAYVDALCREIALAGALAAQKPREPHPVHTIYFGGGTPSLLSLAQFETIVQAIRAAFHLQPGAEISLEANPGTLNPAYLAGLVQLGFNRLSLGMQSARSEDLRLLERQHDTGDVLRAVTWARRAGFANLSLDLIFGIPGQSVQDWARSLDVALSLAAEHLSLYSLTVEENTPLHAWVGRGLLDAPDPDLAADMYDLACERLAGAGYFHYEISNWARHNESTPLSETENPGWACQHNLQYWRNQPYLGLGAGAHGYARDLRVANVLLPQDYIQRIATAPDDGVAGPAVAETTSVDRASELAETMMMGLRLVREGVSAAAFEARFGQPLTQVYARPIEHFTRLGLLEWAGADQSVLRLTRRGYLLGNQVFVEFI